MYEVKLSTGKKISWRRLIYGWSSVVTEEQFTKCTEELEKIKKLKALAAMKKINQKNLLLQKENCLKQKVVLEKNPRQLIPRIMRQIWMSPAIKTL